MLLALLLACQSTPEPAPAPAPPVALAPKPTHVKGFELSSVRTIGLDDAQARQQVEARMPQLRACYETQRALEPETEGGTSMLLTTDATGQVIRAKEDSKDMAGRVQEVAACLLEELKTARFSGKGNVAILFLYGTERE